MTQQKPTVVIAGSGNIAQYHTEELLRDGTYNVAIISRSDRAFFHNKPGAKLYLIKEYAKESILPILNEVKATVVISALMCDDEPVYTAMHKAILEACTQSDTCKRLISSEYLGNLGEYDDVPRDSCDARKPFRAMLRSQSAIQFAFINQGWLGDYFVQVSDGSKSYIRPFPEGWPISMDRTTVRIPGTGEELVSWTAARDMAKAVVKLLGHADWPEFVYLFGDMGTWKEAVAKVEKFLGYELKRTCCSKDEIQAAIEQQEDLDKRYTATMDEWSSTGAAAVPREEAIRQREKYFQGVHFRSINELLEESKTDGII